MGSLTRAYDWASTPIGSPETWSQSHLTCVNMMLTSRFPMLVFWGQDLITFYNDAFRPSLGNEGKHPGSLGQPGHISWAESWPVIGPMINNIMQGGEAVWFEDQKLPLYRDGKMGYAYWTYSFSPLLDDDGSVGGILVTCSETTKAVESTAKLAESEQRFRHLIKEAPVAIFVLKRSNMVIETANDLMLKMIGKDASVIGKPYLEAVPELKGQTFEALLDQVYISGKTYYGNEIFGQINHDGVLRDAYYNFIYQPDKDLQGLTQRTPCVAMDVTQQVQARQLSEKLNAELRFSEESLRLSIEAARLGTYSVNLASGVVTTNRYFREIFGLASDYIFTADDGLSMTKDDETRVREAMNIAIKNDTLFDEQYRIIRKADNKVRWIRSMGRALKDERNQTPVFHGISIDITEQKADEQRKNDFIAMVSHELKTPLTSLNGYLQLLQLKTAKASDTFMTGILGKSVNQTKKMTTMINGFLNVSRLESGKIYIDRQRFDMALLVKEVEEEVATMISSHQVAFALVEETFVYADRDKIGQVISNFISNAVKYSPMDSTIKVACVKITDRTQVSVQDQGMGVAPKDQDKLFDRYYRTNNATASAVAGFGIGLYLCSEIIQRHEGKIWVESELGKGSTFYFSLPLAGDI